MKSFNRGSRHSDTHLDEHGTWAISYGDMITLLLTFFILFFNTDKNQTRLKAMTDGLMKSLGTLEKNQAKSYDVKMNIGETNGSDIDPAVLEKLGAKVTKVGKLVIVEFPELSFFEFSQVDVNSAGQKALKNFVKAYMPYAGSFQIGVRAFTDNTPVLSQIRYRDNLELSALRSIATMRVLQAQGVPLRKMKINGYGELHLPVSENDRSPGSRGQAQARKIILIIEPEQEGNI